MKKESRETIVIGVILGIIISIGLIILSIFEINVTDLEKAGKAMKRGDSSVAITIAHQALNNGDIATAKTIQGMLKSYEKKGLFSTDWPFSSDAHELGKVIKTTLLKTAEKSINEGDFTTAYKVVDELFAEDDGKETGKDLNKRILTNEIASIIGENAGDAAARIVLIITERAKYNSRYGSDEKRNQYEMLQSAIEVARLNGNKELVDKLEPIRKEWETAINRRN